MHKFFSILLALCVAWPSIQACSSRSQKTFPDSLLTLYVMDTAQTLLPDVKVKCGDRVQTTSYDGRVVFSAQELATAKWKISISAAGYKSQRWTKSQLLSLPTGTMVVKLLPDKRKKSTTPHTEESLYAHAMRESTVFMEVEPSKEAMAYSGSMTYDAMEETEAAIMSAPNIYAPGLLTAGEVNDFAKWYLWPHVMDSTHQLYIHNWHIEPRHRYTVQVKNKNGYPIANYPVNLTDRQSNTVFQALTDNTGKAELWNGLFGHPADVDAPVWQTIIVDDSCYASDQVDVMFVFDATGSMGDELRYMQAEMKDVIARAQLATGGLSIRTGALVYRDHGDDYITRISQLSDDIEQTKQFIDRQEANGGGDIPEAVPEALMAAINSADWNEDAQARILFLILDATGHQDSASVALLHEQVLNAAAQGIRIVPIVCSGLDESGEYLMRSIALATNGTSFFLTDDSGIGEVHLKPTTDSLKVEHLNDMMVRTIVEFSAMPACETASLNEQITDEQQFIPNPFETKDIVAHPDIPHGEGVHYLVDVTGKVLGIFNGDVPTDQLPIGVYFIKTFVDGQWFTRKIFVNP